MKILRYVGLNLFFLGAIYFGFYRGNESAHALAIGISWFYVMVAFLTLLLKEEDKIKIAHEPRAVPLFVDIAFDLVIVAIMLTYGLWITSFAYFIHMLIIHSMIDKYSKIPLPVTDKKKEFKF